MRFFFFKQISELHPGYDPMQHPLLFPYGTDGYHIYMKGRNGRKVTAILQLPYDGPRRQLSTAGFASLSAIPGGCLLQD